MSAGNAYSSWFRPPFVETSFNELVVSFCDFSPLITLVTFSVLLLQLWSFECQDCLRPWQCPFDNKFQITLELEIICKSMIISVPSLKSVVLSILQLYFATVCCIFTYLQAFANNTGMPKLFKVGCVIELFVALFVLLRCPFDISVSVGVFVKGPSQISSFFS